MPKVDLAAIQADIDSYSRRLAGLTGYASMNTGPVREALAAGISWYTEHLSRLQAVLRASRLLEDHGESFRFELSPEVLADLRGDRASLEAAFGLFEPAGPGDATTGTAVLTRR